MRCGGIVLCGGKSSRMGRPKATLPFGPELMLQRVIRLLAEAVDPIAVVAAPDQELPPLPTGVLVVRDEREGRGPLEGLSAGLSVMGDKADAVYATSCDVPLLVPGFVRRLVDLLGEHEIVVPVESGSLAQSSPLAPREEAISAKSERPIAQPSPSKETKLFHHPLAAVYRVGVQDRIAALLAADRLRPVFLFDSADTLRVPVEELRPYDADLQTLANLNRPEDYEAALAKAGFTPPRWPASP